MGLLTDVFIATDEELSALRPGTGGPAGLFPDVQGKHIDPVKLATLEAIVTRRTDGMSAEAIDDGLTRDWGEEFVYRVPQSLVSALAALPPDEVARCAAAWAETEEWRLDAPAAIRTHDLTQLIAELCQLARRAQRDGKAMYVWMSL